jgi:hypothetical protein
MLFSFIRFQLYHAFFCFSTAFLAKEKGRNFRGLSKRRDLRFFMPFEEMTSLGLTRQAIPAAFF